MAEQNKRQLLLTRWGSLQSERSSWFEHWKEISQYLMPRTGRFFMEDRNKGQKRHNNIYDSTGTRALSILSAGMMSGMTSPARPWFRLTTDDEDLAKYAPVKLWLAECTDMMLTIFARSNTYNALHSMYGELGGYGTATSLVLPDHNDIIRFYPLTAGEYALATDYRGMVNTCYREFKKPVSELVQEFGYENCSASVRNLWDRGNLDAMVDVVHAIEPRSDRDRDTRKLDNKNMPWKSCYFEKSGDGNSYLRESGFKEYPALSPRWLAMAGNVYGDSPAMEALGDIKQLQHEQLRKAECIDYQTRPPLQVPTSFKDRDADLFPGGISYVDAANPQGGIKSAWEVNLNLQHLLMDIQDVRERIKSSFYADLFLMLANQTNSTMTATEVAERHEEKLLMLGPVLERLHNEMLDPLIETTFARMIESGIVPPPPEELQGKELNVELVSMLAQAQRAVGTNSTDRFVGNLGMVAQMKPDVLDKFDSDRWAESYADMLGVDPQLIVPGDKVALVRQTRAQQMQQAQQAAVAEQQANTAKSLSQASTSGDNMLSDATAAFSGYT